ncbi:DUF3530 family protein [Rheinheimera sp. MMS21-TC3]|uniref:DUF3530 family protein n=1 Tax=Rheinheimera sp. MMS21-TC3 TaxID=3072790 RepID=UPI0028C3A69D|nr:DUF3530 family protein [Rheinheimera sp. MMS21-TC3]WNO62138.1 DUF3530 family protein [Rheinheimera sp. MMS21-TC3]
MRRTFHYFICSLLYFFSISIPVVFAANTAYIAADFERQFPTEERVELSAESAFMALFLPRVTGFQQGTVILIADANEHAASPKYINYLRKHLTELGWNTLSIMPPPISLFDTNSLNSYQQQLQQRTATAINYAKREPGAIVIISQGSSAAIINQLYAQQQLTTPAALIILGTYSPVPELNKQFAQAIASHAVPVLDISNSADNEWGLSQLKQRQQQVEKNFKAVYRQRLIAGSGYSESNQSWVLQEIYGWLVSIGL